MKAERADSILNYYEGRLHFRRRLKVISGVTHQCLSLVAFQEKIESTYVFLWEGECQFELHFRRRLKDRERCKAKVW